MGRDHRDVGIGAGGGRTGIEYASLWARNPNGDAIATGEELPNTDEIRRNLAGSTSSAQVPLSDTQRGYQVAFGIEHALGDTASLGPEERWLR